MKGLYQIKSRSWLLLMLIACLASSATFANEADLTWKFKVFLDKKEVGEHDYRVRSMGDQTTVETTARFDVKILFINAFRYRHNNTEVWDQQGMVSIDALTTQNGKEFVVRGQREGGAFILNNGEEVQQLPEYLMSFAYWNPDMLSQTRLLNSQTGDYESVEIIEIGRDTVGYQGQSLSARKFEIRLEETAITVWYGEECSRWLALESPAKGGRVIRYEPMELPLSVGFAMEPMKGWSNES